jgi:cytochrome c553
MKKLLYGLGAVVGIAILGVAGFLLYFLVILPKDLPVPELAVEITPARVERGSYLANEVLGCMYCHSKRDYDYFGGPVIPGTLGQGGEVFDEKVGVSGYLVSQNITPYGIGDWSDGELYRAIVSGLHKDGYAMFPIMPFDVYLYLTDEDVYSVMAYVRSLEPIESENPGRELSTIMTIIANSRAIPAEPWDMDWNNQLQVGEYYARIGGCTFCHERMQPIEGMYLAGGLGMPWKDKLIRASNITADPETGIGNWSEADFIKRFTDYRDNNIAVADVGWNSSMAWPVYAHIKEEDLAAIYAYLMAQPPVKHAVTIVDNKP